MWWFWLILALAAFVIEILTPGTLVSIWFCMAAVLTAGLSLLTGSMLIQVIAFGLLSFASMLMLRPMLSHYLLKEPSPTNVNRYIGRVVKVVKTIEPHETGYVRMDGIDWSASASSPVPIAEGDFVKIEAVSGNRLIVRKETSNYGNSDQLDFTVRRTDRVLNSTGPAAGDHRRQSH